MRYRDAVRLVDSIRHKDLSEKTKTLLLGVSGGLSAILLIQRFVIEPISHIININNIENGKITEQQFIDKIKKLYRIKAKTLYSTLVESDMYPDEANKFGGLTFANMNEYRNAQKRIENARSINDLVAVFPNSTYLKKAQAAFAQRMMNKDSRIFDYGVKGMKKGVRKKKKLLA